MVAQILGNNMKILEFSFIDQSYKYDFKFQHAICWSRIYEYPLVLDYINKTDIENPKIHNCCWGFRDIHLVFKTWLDVKYENVIHSDIKPATFYNTETWDIRTPSKYKDEFDIVINVSTLEEVPNSDHVILIEHHLDQLREGGILILTFDYPGLQLEKVEEYVGQKISQTANPLTPRNSAWPDQVLHLPDDFKVGYLIIQK